MYKNIYKVIIVGVLFLSFSIASALTKPGPEANIDNLSYVFYLYYDNGQLFADRDYSIKFDVVDETFVPETLSGAGAYKGEIVNLKSEIAKTFNFDPKRGDVSFTAGKVMIKGPYVADGMKAQFYNDRGEQLISMFINAGSICNDDGSCNSATGEGEKTCPNDCKKPRATPVPQVSEQTSGLLGDIDWISIAIYGAGGVGVGVLAWFGWKWWKKRKEGNFIPPPPSSPPMPPPSPPSPFNL